MHQTFYIDIDEEMSSVIDRLNKSMSSENYFVVPKRALFLQSIVNLKILKREADKMSKKVIIVTQDEMVVSMAERCGIDTRENLDGVEVSAQEELEEDQDNDDVMEEEMEEEFEKKIDESEHKKNRLKNIGSGDFYQGGSGMDVRSIREVKDKKSEVKSSALKTAAKKVKSRPEKIVLKKVTKEEAPKSGTIVNGIRHTKSQTSHEGKGVFKNKLDPHKAETLEKMFSNNTDHRTHQEKHKPKNIGNGKVKKVFALFMILCVLVFVGVAAYIFAPSAKVILKTDINKKKIDTEIIVSNEQNIEGKNIALKTIDKDEEFSFPYEVKGTNEAIGKKARGKVVLYNEYSSEPQTLVATTRLEAENGKIFRLVKNVVIPGSSNIGGQIKPGAIQAEIIADQAGSDYNMDATKFKIPGFAGGPKFDKFYASSDASTTGGSGEGQGEAVSRQVIQTDLDSARQKAEAAFKENIIQQVKDDLGSNEVLLDQAQKITINKSSSSARVGTLANSIEWVVSGSVRALVFDENDVKKVILESIDENGKTNQFKNEILKIDYGSVEPDFDKPSMKVRIYCEVTSTPYIDTEKIKKELLGKDDSQLVEILRKYSSIKNASVEFSPSFMTHIPSYDSRVYIEVVNEAK